MGRASRDNVALSIGSDGTDGGAGVDVERASGEGEGAVEAGWAGMQEEGEEEEKEKLVVCQRCYRLRNYGSVEDTLRPGFSDSDLLTPQRFLVSVVNW